MGKKRILMLLFIPAVVLLLFAGVSFSLDPNNLGDVNGTTDVFPLVLLDGDSYYAPIEAQGDLKFTVDGRYPECIYGSPNYPGHFFDALILRTTLVSGDLEGLIWYTFGDPPIFPLFLKDEEISGDFSAIFDITSSGLQPNTFCDVTFNWDFTLEEKRYMMGVLHAQGYWNNTLQGDTASCDVGVVLLEETPTFDIFVGKSGEDMQYARSLGPVTSTDCDLDAGLVFLSSDDDLGIIYANFWNEQVELSSVNPGFSVMYHLFAPDLYNGNGPSAMMSQWSNYVIDPSLAIAGYINSIGSQEDSFSGINFADGTVTHLSWIWCELIYQDEDSANAVGFAGNPTSADLNEELDDKIFKVLVSDDFWPFSVNAEDFNIDNIASSGDFIGQVSMDINIPLQADVLQKWAIPVGLRIRIPRENIEQYDEELMQTVDAELGENPTKEELEAAVRKYISFTKEWSTGETAQIRLDDPEFADAVDIYFEMDGEGGVNNIFFEFTLLIVNGGEAGVIDSATANGRSYIVIYDGNLDLSFADPLKLVAATEPPVGDDDDDDATIPTSGVSGCSALGFTPAAGLLLLPFVMLLKK